MSGGRPAASPEEELSEHRRRLVLLARLLPFEHLRLLDADLDELEAEACGASSVEGLSDSVELIRCDVEPALREVWARTLAG